MRVTVLPSSYSPAPETEPPSAGLAEALMVYFVDDGWKLATRVLSPETVKL